MTAIGQVTALQGAVPVGFLPVRVGSLRVGSVRIRSWRAGDEALLAEAGPQISPASLRARFLAGTPRLPEAYLRHIARLPRGTWDAEVALRGDPPTDQVVGWAEFVRLAGGSGPGGAGPGSAGPGETEADFAILVLDSWQRRGVGRALVRSLLPRAAAAGIRTLHADIDPGNEAARGLLAAVLGRERLTARFVDGLLHYTMRLD
jgi:GNAT superfamily N-acetyltransferase